MEREKGFERCRRWVNILRQDASLPLNSPSPFAIPVPTRSTRSRPVPAFGAAAGHMWGTGRGLVLLASDRESSVLDLMSRLTPCPGSA